MKTIHPRDHLFAGVCCAILVASACAGGRPHVSVLPPVSAGVPAVIRTAESLVGVPYRHGGADPAGFDCSGFVHYVYARHAVSVPRDVQRQWRSGRAVARDGVRAGDLLFFATTGPGPTHVTLALGADRFVHAPSSRGAVRVETLASAYWAQRYVGARRVID